MNMVSPVSSIDTAPWACFIGCNEPPGQRRRSMKRIWLPLPKPTDGGFGRSAIGKEGRFTFRVSVYSGENKVPLLPRWMEMFQCNQPARQRVMDGPLGYVAIGGVRCWFLLLRGWSLWMSANYMTLLPSRGGFSDLSS